MFICYNNINQLYLSARELIKGQVLAPISHTQNIIALLSVNTTSQATTLVTFTSCTRHIVNITLKGSIQETTLGTALLLVSLSSPSPLQPVQEKYEKLLTSLKHHPRIQLTGSHTLFRMLTNPLYKPSAKYWPSLVQLHAVILLPTLCLFTDFCSGDHRPTTYITRILDKTNRFI